MKKNVFYILFLLFPMFLHSQESTYRNPVIAGDFPDPTIIRVGDTYYAAGTSSEWAPPYRLYESEDLVNWRYIGGLFRELPNWTMGSFWAPELFYKDGTFYVYYTARRESDKKSFIGVGTTKNIHEGFTDHGMLVEWTNEAIDAFVVEENGKLYITWKAYGLDRGRDIEIIGSELSADGLSLKGEVFSLIKAERGGWENGGAEGQCIVKNGQYLYMFYAGNGCCGIGCDYQVGVARARSIKGPWEKYSGNPILHGGGQWNCPGHGTLVEVPGKRYFFMYHAYNASTNVYSGRQGLLDEIIWDKSTGWPAFRYGKTPSIQAATPLKGTTQYDPPRFSDEFEAGLRPEWTWSVSQPASNHEIKNGRLELKANSFLGLRQEKSNYQLEATIIKSGGIGLCGTKDKAIGISYRDNRVELWQIHDGIKTITASEVVADSESIDLFITVSFNQYCRLGIKLSDGKQKIIGNSIHLQALPQWDRPPMIGVFTDDNPGSFERISIK